MNNASTPDGRGQDRPHEAEPFFPSEGTFHPVVPLSEIGHPLAPVNPADVGKPAEARWAREAHRASWKEDEDTLVPTRAGGTSGGARRSWVVTAAVVALSVVAGLASGTYLIWSSQNAPEAQPPAQVAAEAKTIPPAPAAEQAEAFTKVEDVNETARDERPNEVAKAEKSGEAAHAPKQAPPLRPVPATRAERPARAAAEAREVTPAPKPARTQSAASTRPRLTTVVRQQPAPPISSPPPTAKSKKVIQWP